MAKKKDKQEKHAKRGCVLQSMFLICIISSFLLLIAMILMVIPQDTHDIEGYGEAVQGDEARDLIAVLEESLERGHQVTLSEREINRWIGRTLEIEQKGLLGPMVNVDGLALRLEEDLVELVIERSFVGLKLTQSMYLQVLVESDDIRSNKQVQLHAGPLVKFVPLLKKGGRFGKLSVPQGYIHLVKPAFFQLGEVYEKELNLIFRRMHDIQVKEGAIILKPKPERPDLIEI
ncbi:MAG: hypothetical protein R3242_10460 [Akkermansiaceae bacterium]|nr:hypothetical protein [Akkermansiaceae bacterium]